MPLDLNIHESTNDSFLMKHFGFDSIILSWDVTNNTCKSENWVQKWKTACSTLSPTPSILARAIEFAIVHTTTRAAHVHTSQKRKSKNGNVKYKLTRYLKSVSTMAMVVANTKNGMLKQSNVLFNFVKIPPAPVWRSDAESIRRKRLILPKSSRTLHNYMFLLRHTEACLAICDAEYIKHATIQNTNSHKWA